MKILFKTILLGGILIAQSLQAQTPQEMINRAKAAGMSDAQIQQEIEKYMGQKEDDTYDTAPKKMKTVPNIERKNPVSQKDSPNPVNASQKVSSRTINSIFGHDIFTDKRLTFEPDLNMPTPKDYQLSAGDEVFINVWGASEINLTQKVSPEGTITIPNVGPVALSGLTMDEAGVQVKQALGRIMSGLVNGEDSNTFISVSLAQIRSIKVNIVGEAQNPGTYTLPSVASLFNALYAAGGINSIGTLRDIKVYRDNKEIASLDVYDYLLNGKSDSNLRLENNDMIIIGTYDALVKANGKLKRPQIFELKKGETMQDFIKYAGGFNGDAFTDNIRVIRKSGSSRYSVAMVNQEEFGSFLMMDQDSVIVDQVIPLFANRLTVNGAVWRQGEYEFDKDVNTVKQLIAKAGGVKGDEFTGRAQINRQNPDFTRKIIAIDIKGILNGTTPDFELEPEDILYIPSLFDLREKYVINIRGAVNKPNTVIPFKNNMTVEDAIISAGGLKEAAAMIKVEVARRLKDPYSDQYKTDIAHVYTFTLSENLEIVQGEELFTLEPFDEIIVRFSPAYTEQQLVQINGEALFTGPYVLTKKDERMSDLVAKAGGISKHAYVKGANLKRQANDDEMRRVETLLQLSSNKASRDSTDINSDELYNYTVGIDLAKALKKPGGTDDIILRAGDELFIPQYQGTVKIGGAVIYPNSTTYTKGMSVKKYLSQAGGYNDVARKYPIVIYMNGKVATTKKVCLFFKKYPKIEPGAEILVPMRRKQDRRSSLAEILTIGSSTTSMAAMITTIINSMKK